LTFQQHIQVNKQNIIKDAVDLGYTKAAQKWHIGNDTLSIFMYEAGLVKVEELPLSIRNKYTKRLGTVAQPTAPPTVAPVRPPVTAGPEVAPAKPIPTEVIRPTTVQIVEAVGWLIQRRNELEEENKKLKAELSNLAEVLSKRKEQDKILASLRDLLGK